MSLILNGPRQAGKTTLLRHLQQRHGGTLLNLDDEQLLQAAMSDPLAFAGSGSEPRLIDEVQRAGDPLVTAIKAEVDTVPRPGRYVLAGSTRFLASPSLSESLAGRGAVVDVWPFSQGEFAGKFESFIDTAFDEPHSLSRLAPSQVDRALAKQATWSETAVRLHHWRVSGGAEVDVVLERDDGKVIGIESKARDTVTAEDLRGLATLRDLLATSSPRGSFCTPVAKRGQLRRPTLVPSHLVTVGARSPVITTC